jgi:hypothetical protein
MPDWSIKIVPASNPAPGAPAAFEPDVPGAGPNDPLQALQDDLVTWNNTTNEAHWPWPADANFGPLPDSQVPRSSPNYLSDQIPPGKSSRPSYDVVVPQSGNTIHYCCKLHPGEHGTITVSPIPDKLPQPPTKSG